MLSFASTSLLDSLDVRERSKELSAMLDLLDDEHEQDDEHAHVVDEDAPWREIDGSDDEYPGKTEAVSAVRENDSSKANIPTENDV